MSVLVKTCGMSRACDVEAVNAARPDFCGFIVNFPKSKRNVDVEQLVRLRGMLDPGIAAVGVFVDQDAAEVARIARIARLDLVQLHGHEDDAYIGRLRTMSGAAILKAFVVRDGADVAAARASSADWVLLDNGYGTGRAFDWTLAEGLERPFFLAGGLNPGNIAQAVARFHPYAVDLSSGLETDGAKDPAKIEAAVRAARGS